MPIMVNKVEITDDEVHQEMQHHPAPTMEDARHLAAQALVIRQLLVQKAKEMQFLKDVASPEKEGEAIDALLAQEVAIPQANDTNCARYYEQNKQRFIDKTTGNVLPLELVSDRIRDYLYAQSMQSGISQYIKLLAGKARVAGFEFEGSDSPLVQ